MAKKRKNKAHKRINGRAVQASVTGALLLRKKEPSWNNREGMKWIHIDLYTPLERKTDIRGFTYFGRKKEIDYGSPPPPNPATWVVNIFGTKKASIVFHCRTAFDAVEKSGLREEDGSMIHMSRAVVIMLPDYDQTKKPDEALADWVHRVVKEDT